MVNTDRSVPYAPTEGLDTPGDIAEYLDIALEEQGDRVLLLAIRNSVRASVPIGNRSRLRLILQGAWCDE